LLNPYKTSYTIRKDSKGWSIQEVKGSRCDNNSYLEVSRHWSEAASEASRILGMINRWFRSSDNEGFEMTIYKGYISPYVKYIVLVTVHISRY